MSFILFLGIKMKKLAILAIAVASASAFAYGPGAGFAIPDNDPIGASSMFNVVGAGTIVSIDSVTLTFDTAHTWAGDLIVTFKNVNTGKDVHLFSRVGATVAGGVGDSSDLLGAYTFTTGGASFATAAAATASTVVIAPGSYARASHAAGIPAGAFFDADDYSIFTGDAIAGDWQLSISDNAGGDTGSISSWSFEATVSTVPEPTSMAVIGLGVLCLARRRRKSN